MNKSAAKSLLGVTLNNDWIVIKEIEKDPSATGGFFSCCYLVENKKKERAFLKAIDVESYFTMYSGDLVTALKKMTDTYSFERDLLRVCKEKKLSKVSLILDEGEAVIPGFTINKVPYLIFELAEGDVRACLDLSENIDNTWKLKSLHNVIVGLKQLHSINISHQDLKPSNILTFKSNSLSKIGDIGRSISKDIKAPHDDGRFFSGSWNYAPPEALYGYSTPEWNKRAFSVDNYLMGSLIVFYFTYLNMTTLIFDNLSEEFHYTRWKGDYPQVLPYITEAFYRGLDDFTNEIETNDLREELKNIVKELCNPNPELRGHPRNKLGTNPNQYCLNRYVAKFDILYRKSKYNLFKKL